MMGMRLLPLQIFLWDRGELRAASGRAEIVSMPLVLMTVLRGVRIDGHPAHRIKHRLGRCVIVMMMCSLGHDAPG